MSKIIPNKFVFNINKLHKLNYKCCYVIKMNLWNNKSMIMKGKLNRQNVYLNLYENYYNARRHEKSIVQVGKKIVKIILKICIVEIPSRTKPSNCNNPENDKLIIA